MMKAKKLNEGPVITKKLISEEVACDICGRLAKFDDKTIFGPWSYMCKPCHDVLGVGIGYELIVIAE